ncbi:MAG: hypothetical protein JWP97_4808 [Labilithrix sp.]|nr:hypothetical protein [Labilithrix sp.]
MAVAALLAASATLGCGLGKTGLVKSPYEIIDKGAPVAAAPPDVTAPEWRLARRRLGRLRDGQPGRPYVEKIRIAVDDPRSGKRFEARGAVAISPDKAARMMLVGPGGATALDVWVTKERFRFAVPAVKLEKRGGRDPAESRGLPIGMLRWWFLSPLGGRLLVARSNAQESSWVLREGGATVTLRTDGNRFVALRREGETLEGIEWTARGLVPQSGAHGQYIEGRFGLRVEVLVEEVLEAEPDPEAFTDPDVDQAPAAEPGGRSL